MNSNPPVALTANRSNVVVLLWLIRWWLVLPLWDSVIVLCFVVRYFVSILVLQVSQCGRRAGCFALFVFLVCCDCCLSLPHGVTGLYAVHDCGIS